MSKIIKAQFVIEDTWSYPRKVPPVTGLDNGSSLAPQPEPQDTGLTPEMSEKIYNETKLMIEELMGEAQNEAEKILAEAKSQAEDLLEASRSEGEEIRQQAYKDGYEKGYQEGLEKSRSEMEKLSQQFRLLTENLAKEREELRKQYEQDLIDLVLLLTEKIIGTTAETKPEIISHIVSRVLNEAGEFEKAVIRVNPVHLSYLEHFNEPNSLYYQKVQLVEDTSLNPGECVVNCDNGFIEARISEQLEILKKSILDVTGHAGD